MTTVDEKEEELERLPLMEVSNLKFLLSTDDGVTPKEKKEEIKKQILEEIKKENMAPFYETCGSEIFGSIDMNLLFAMKNENEKSLAELDAKIKDAVENLGESEVRLALLAKAQFYTRIGDKENAINQFRQTDEKTIGTGQKFDIIFCQIRIGYFWMDHDLIKRNIEKAKTMEDKLDWDRKNRLKVYEAIYAASRRQFKKACNLLLSTLATYTAVELFDYETYIYYTVLLSVISLDRVKLKEKVVDAPEILSVIEKIPLLQSLLHSLYYCNYTSFYASLAGITDQLKANKYLSAHVGFYCKEMRIIAYQQVLESYSHVQLANMAQEFGVSIDFLDNELSRFIASGRLACKIDKVSGVIETTRSDIRNSKFNQAIKQGDGLLNRLQKLGRFVFI